MALRLASILLCIFLPFCSKSQDLSAYFDTSRFYQADSIFFKADGGAQVLYILYAKEDGESVIIHKNGSGNLVYNGFLPCYTCQGRGSVTPTYSGYEKKGAVIVLVHEYFSGRDSVYINFSGGDPFVQKIVKRSYNNEITPGVDDPGNYELIRKKGANTTIRKFQLPIDRNDPKVKQLFVIRKID